MRLDLFEALLAAQRNFGDSLEGEAKRYLERSIKLDRRNGESRTVRACVCVRVRAELACCLET